MCWSIYKKKRRSTLAILLALCMLLCLFLSACGESEVHIEAISIWYLKDDFFSSWLEGYASDFHSRKMRLELTGFDTENELAQALDSKRPDLMLCSGRKAFALYEQDKLSITAVIPDDELTFIPTLSDLGGVGTAYFPLGFDSFVMISGSAAQSDSHKSLEDFFSAAEKYTAGKQRPYFAMSSFCEYFYSYMEQYGEHFSGIRETDIKSKKYVYLYNLLAEASFSGAMDLGEASPARAVASGALPYAFVNSSELSGIDMTDLKIQPIPAVKGCTALSWAQVYGLAITTENESKNPFIAEILNDMLSQPGLNQACFACGCLPAQQFDSTEASNPLVAALFGIKDLLNISIPQSGSGYYASKSSFEDDFRAAMELLGHCD